MSDIECPHCHQKFEMDAAGYASIVNQVRSAEFEAEVSTSGFLASLSPKQQQRNFHFEAFFVLLDTMLGFGLAALGE